MTTRKRTLLSWSSGKDSAWALHLLRQQPEIELVGLFTTLNQRYDRVAMHAVRRTLLEQQAAAVGLPLEILPIPDPCSNEEYAQVMTDFVRRCQQQQISHMAFGDLYLEDIRSYREQQLAASGITTLFPLWGLPTEQLSRTMLAAGVEAYLTSVDPRRVPAAWAGQRWSLELLATAPAGVDPCGENGEFHSCVVNGPMFSQPLRVTAGDVVHRDGFVFADLLPQSQEA